MFGHQQIGMNWTYVRTGDCGKLSFVNDLSMSESNVYSNWNLFNVARTNDFNIHIRSKDELSKQKKSVMMVNLFFRTYGLFITRGKRTRLRKAT